MPHVPAKVAADQDDGPAAPRPPLQSDLSHILAEADLLRRPAEEYDHWWMDTALIA